MAHDECIGRWEESKRGGVKEGSGFFVTRPNGGDVINGNHEGHDNSRIVGTCDGTTIKFCMTNETTGEVICYKGTITRGASKYFINGKWTKPLNDQDAVVVTDSIVIQEGKRLLLAPDDWTAERPT
jgi:hypothetical protein